MCARVPALMCNMWNTVGWFVLNRFYLGAATLCHQQIFIPLFRFVSIFFYLEPPRPKLSLNWAYLAFSESFTSSKLCKFICTDVAELIFGWTEYVSSFMCFLIFSQFLSPNFAPVHCSVFSYCFSPMLYRAAGWCPQQTPDIWQAGPPRWDKA